VNNRKQKTAVVLKIDENSQPSSASQLSDLIFSSFYWKRKISIQKSPAIDFLNFTSFR
jgi:hypothetical protein